MNAILQLETQGECRESATEAVFMVGYTTEGISNQEQTRWLSWNVDGGVSRFDLARNPGLSNNTEYGADPVALAGWGLEFFWSCDAADVGIPGDDGYGQDVRGHSDDGDQ